MVKGDFPRIEVDHLVKQVDRHLGVQLFSCRRHQSARDVESIPGPVRHRVLLEELFQGLDVVGVDRQSVLEVLSRLVRVFRAELGSQMEIMIDEVRSFRLTLDHQGDQLAAYRRIVRIVQQNAVVDRDRILGSERLS